MLSFATIARSAAITAAIAAMVPLAGTAQTTAKKTPVPRTADGRPNLQGTWVFTHRIPLLRDWLANAEHIAIDSPLRYFGGFLIAIARKRDDCSD